MAGIDQDARTEVVGLTGGRRLVVAGPGSGKTQLLTDRLVALLSADARAREVLVLVFNRAAASELRARLAQALPDRGFVELRIATFHSLALSLVERHWGPLGFPRRPALIDEAQRSLVIAELLTGDAGSDGTAGGHDDGDVDGWGRPAEVRSSQAFVEAVVSGLSALEAGGDTPLGRFRARYRDRLRQRGVVDLAEVVGLAGDLLDDPDVRRSLRLRHLLVDEVQDLDAEQYRLVRLLAADAHSAVLVGDPRQSIYGFRGADPTRLAELAASLDARVVALSVSHRCRQPILDAAVALVSGQHLDVGELVAGPSTTQDRPAGVGAIGFPREADETDWIAEQLRIRHMEGTPWSELAVLCRDTPVTMPAVLAALRRAKVPHTSSDVTARVPHPWVLRLDDLLRLTVQGREPDDELLAIELAAGSPLVQADPIAVRAAVLDVRGSTRPRAALASWCSDEGGDTESTRALGRLLTAINDAAKANREGADVAEVAWRLWRSLPLARRLARLTDTAELTDAEREGVAAASSWFRRIQTAADDHPGLRADAWLAQAAVDPTGDTFVAGTSAPGGVAVMTIHQAKGLQWDHVFVPGLVEGRFPVATRSRPLVDVIPPDVVDEERRLLYVAITRARHTATLTCTVGAEERMEAAPSRFLRDLVDHLRDPAELVPAAPGEVPLAQVGTRRQAEQAWARSLRAPGTPLAERVAAAHGLARLGAPTSWIDVPVPSAPAAPYREAWTLSATGLETLDRCPRQFLSDRVLRLSPFDGNEHSAFGTAVHRGIDAWLTAHEYPDRTKLHDRLRERYEAEVVPVLPSAALDGPFRRKLERIADVTARWFATGKIGEPVLIETDLEHPYSDDVLVRSRVDLVARNDTGLEILDWKTGSKSGQSVRGSRQLQTYYWLLRRLRPGETISKIRLGFVATESSRPTTQLVGEDYDVESAAFVDAMVDLVTAEAFEPTPGPHCERCDFRSMCPADGRGQESPW